MRILFTICGRAGSKGFKNKNLKEMRGVPLVYYSLAVIKGYMDRNPGDDVQIAVNTDSESLVSLVNRQEMLSGKYVERKPELAGDIVPKVDVIKDTMVTCNEIAPDVIVDLDITSPMRRVLDIENIIAEYRKGIYDLVYSVVKARRSPYFNMVERKEDGFFRKICSAGYTARQQAPISYEMNASIYAYSPCFLESKITRTITDYNCGVSIMQDYLVLDIDSEEDFQMMQRLHEYYCNRYEDIAEVYTIAKDFLRK